jgi:hypothetical protein
VALSLVVFVISLFAFLLALRFVDGVAWPAVIGVFCGFAAATVLNATDVMARRKGRDPTGGETDTGGCDDQRGTAAYHSPTAKNLACRSAAGRSRSGFEHLPVGYWVYQTAGARSSLFSRTVTSEAITSGAMREEGAYLAHARSPSMLAALSENW